MDHILNDGYRPTWRKPAGAFLIIALIIVWAVLVLIASPWINALPVLVQTVSYLIVGVAWILPLKPLLLWMETGRWR